MRIYPDGKISYSQRLTIWASCTMDLRKFPLDSHICRLEIGSFGFTAQDVVYRSEEEVVWRRKKSYKKIFQMAGHTILHFSRCGACSILTG